MTNTGENIYSPPSPHPLHHESKSREKIKNFLFLSSNEVLSLRHDACCTCLIIFINMTLVFTSTDDDDVYFSPSFHFSFFYYNLKLTHFYSPLLLLPSYNRIIIFFLLSLSLSFITVQWMRRDEQSIRFLFVDDYMMMMVVGWIKIKIVNEAYDLFICRFFLPFPLFFLSLFSSIHFHDDDYDVDAILQELQ